MALCIAVETAVLGGPPSALSVTGRSLLLWPTEEAALSGGVYSCPSGSHLLLSVAEASQNAALGITSADVLTAFTWGLSGVLGLWVVGWVVGVVVGVIRRA